MSKVNQLKNALIEAKGLLHSRTSALAQIQEEQAAARAKYLGFVDKAAKGPLSDDEKGAQATAKTAYDAFEDRVSAARTLEVEASKDVLRVEKELAAEEKRVADLPTTEAATTKIEVGDDNATKRPWRAGIAGLGEFALAVRQAHTGNGVDARLFKAAASGLNEAMGPEGGFAVPMEYAAGIEKEMFETGELLSRVDTRNITGNAITYNIQKETSRVDGSRQGGVLGYWVDEGDAPDATKPAFSKLELKLKKVACLGYTTEELDADAAALGEELQIMFRDELLFQVENKIYRGTGAGCPQGFLEAPCLVTVAKETGQTAGTINVKNLSKMWARMPARSKKNAVWFINVDCEPQLDELALLVGTGALEPRFVTYGPDGLLRIKGRPVVAVEYAATVGSLGDIVLVDMTRYRLIRKNAGVQQASSIHVRFAQGENTYRSIYRVDGQAVPRSAITPFQGSNSLSPFVALAARA